MAYSAKIIADSVGPNGKRLTTFEITYPKFVHNELMTHRMLSRNTASSRAIPYKRTRNQVLIDPVMPVWWGKNQAGMQAREQLDENQKTFAVAQWLAARDDAVARADCLNYYEVHKQIVNRVIEPWMWITAIVTATEWENFFHLRCHPDAQPEIHEVAVMMEKLYRGPSVVKQLKVGQWHMPYVKPEDFALIADVNINTLLKVSVARCARVSYLTHDDVRDVSKDVELFERLQSSGHWSPFEHVAQAVDHLRASGNFYGWRQFRKCFGNENFTGSEEANEDPR